MDVFYLKAGDRSFLRVREILEGMGSDVRVKTSLYAGARFPMTYPLPKRLDPDFQAYTGLFRYDLIVFADVDPEVLTPKEMRDIVAYVEQGGGLLLTGGKHCFGSAMGTYEAWDSILPVAIERREPSAVNARPELADEHPITAGIPVDRLGTVGEMHALTARSGARTPLLAGEHPLLITGERHEGRVAILNTHAHHDANDDFFFSDYYDDLMRQAVRWLVGATPSVTVSYFEAPDKQLPADQIDSVHAVLRNETSEPVKVSIIAHNDGTEELSDDLLESATERDVWFSYAMEERGAFHFNLTAQQEGKETELVRDWEVVVTAPAELDVEIRPRKTTLVPGYPAEFRLALRREGRGGARFQARARLVDFDGNEVADFPAQAIGSDPITHAYTLPQLASGSYHLVGELLNKGEVVDSADARFEIVDRLELVDFFPLISDLKEQVLDQEDLQLRIDDIVDKGFNVLQMHQHSGRTETEPLSERMENWAEGYALRNGLALNLYQSFHWGFYPGPGPCPNSPGFAEAQRSALADGFRNVQDIPNVVGAMVGDEPHMNPEQTCYCENCQALYRKQHGRDMPRYEEVHYLPEAERIDFFRFLSDYGTRCFEQMMRAKKEAGVDFKLAHTFDIRSFGALSSSRDFRDAFAWTEHCDWLDWDIYQYMYPLWRATDKIIFNASHYTYSGYRSLAQYYDKPYGFWVELDDRNYPHIVVSPKASGEIAYTSLAQGVDFLKTFINFPFSDSRWGIRKERFDAFGVEMNKFKKYSPLLTRTKRPRAPIAAIHPFSNWIIAPKHMPEDRPEGNAGLDRLKRDHLPLSNHYPFEDPAHNAFELAQRAFGQIDLLDERLVTAGELKHYPAVALFDIEYLPKEIYEEIAEYVRNGGVVIADRLPDKDIDGSALDVDLLGGLFDGEDRVVDGSMRAKEGSRSLLFSESLHEAYSVAVEEDDPLMRSLLERAIRDFLFGAGIRSQARPVDVEFEAGLRLGKDCAALVLVNHGQETATSLIELFDLPFVPEVAFNMGTMEEIPLELSNGRVSMEVEIDDLNGRVVGLYPDRIAGNRIELDKGAYKRGEDLSYTVVVENDSGAGARGHHVVDIDVIDPQGVVRGRYGGKHTTDDGVYTRSHPLAVNEQSGEWTISLYERYSRCKSEATFQVS